MALPSSTTVQTLQFSLDGSPWCKVAAKSGIDLDGLGFSLDGSPWWGVEVATGTTTWKLYVGVTQITTMYIGSTEATTAYLGENVLKS